MYRTGLSNTLRLDLKHGAGEGPVAGEVDEVEDDAQPHGDAQQRAVAPPAPGSILCGLLNQFSAQIASFLLVYLHNMIPDLV